MNQARADSIAYYAVRESYRNGNSAGRRVRRDADRELAVRQRRDVERRRRRAHAGLPKVWLKALSAKFGKDLAADSTNLKYGIYILKQYIKSDSGAVDAERREQRTAPLQRLRARHATRRTARRIRAR